MLPLAFLACAFAVTFSGTKAEGKIYESVKIAPLLKSDHAALKKLAAQIDVNVEEVIFGMEVIVLRTLGKQGTKEYVPKGVGLYVAIVLTKDKGRCFLDFFANEDEVITQHALARCATHESVVKIFQDVEEIKNRIYKVLVRLKGIAEKEDER